MIPYLAVPAIHAGPLAISAYGVFAFASIVIGQTISLRRAVRSGLDAGAARQIIFWSTCAGLVGSHFWWVAWHHWQNVFSLQGMVSYGGFLGISACILMMRSDKLKWFDAAAYSLVFGQLVGRIGCALVHDHPGVPSQSVLAVAFPDGPRFDLGILELLFLIPLSIATWHAGKRIWRPGTIYGTIFVIYAMFRLSIDPLRLDRTEDLWGATLMIAAGIWALLSRQ